MCKKKWGDNFRPEFKKIGVIPKGVNMMALTATATVTSRLAIQRILGMKNPVVVEGSPDIFNCKGACLNRNIIDANC